jgi:predicted  nucleic acid-binding Zn-ribbon protein
MLAEILGGGGLAAVIAFGLKMMTMGREMGRLEQRLATMERDQSDIKAENVRCRDERQGHGERMAKMRGEIEHTRADVARALADKG